MVSEHGGYMPAVEAASGLNPCSSGRWSLRAWESVDISEYLDSLNPCSSGRWSLSGIGAPIPMGAVTVLILVLLEDGL